MLRILKFLLNIITYIKSIHIFDTIMKQYFGTVDECLTKGYQIIENDITIIDGKRKCVIFDIDDTLIYSDTKQPIDEIVKLYNYCYSKGYVCVIITARSDDIYGNYYTRSQLANLNIKYHLIYFYTKYHGSTYKYKLSTRKMLTENLNLVPVLSVGDMYWDVGEYGGTGLVVE